MRRVPVKLVVAVAGIAVGACVYSFPPQKYGFYPRCPFNAATHLLCPGCGGTRALYEMLHGNLVGAWHYNALLTVLGPLACLWFAFEWIRAERNHRAIGFQMPRAAWALAVAATLLFTVVRNTGLAFAI